MRTVHIDGERWRYKVGRTCVVIKTPNNKRLNVSIVQVLGISWDAIERARWKHTNYANVTPSIVKRWILIHGK